MASLAERMELRRHSHSTASAGPLSQSAQVGVASDAALPIVDSVTDYEKHHRVGQGTYGVVYKARDLHSGEVVALKKVVFEGRSRGGMPVTSLRELRVLQQCRHPNIVELKRVVTGSRADSVFLVFEYCPHDLGRLLDWMPKPFSESEVKCLMKQLLQAVAYMHGRWIMHRDLKLSNLLLTASGTLKLCDFGLARYFQPFPSRVTPRVVTLWYRAPEVLLGSEAYDEAVDMWAVGCILGELLRHEPLFPAESEAECLQMLARLLGSPSVRIWPGMADLPLAANVRWPDQPYNLLRRHFPALSEAGIALLNGLLTYDPTRRLTAREALHHPYFTEKPFPKQPHDMPTFPSSHEPGPRGTGATSVGGDGGGSRKRRWGALQQEQEDAARLRARELADKRFGEAFGGNSLARSRLQQRIQEAAPQWRRP